MVAVIAPWKDTLTSGEHSLIFYSLVIAGLALLGYLLKTALSLSEVGTKYRPAVLASIAITGIAFVSYVVLVLKFDLGYDPKGSNWVPNSDALLSWSPRYMDWSVTVPLLMIELIAVSALTGVLARRVRFLCVGGAFGMIFTGYLGGVVIGDGENLGALWLWGVISGLFMVGLYVLILFTVLKTLPGLEAEARGSYRSAMILLMVIWFAYPIAFGLQGFASGGGRTTAMQVVLSFADIVAKVGFGVLIHKVAKLRTAQDVNSGTDTHPETVWMSGVKHSDSIQPPVQAPAVVAPAGQPRFRRNQK